VAYAALVSRVASDGVSVHHVGPGLRELLDDRVGQPCQELVLGRGEFAFGLTGLPLPAIEAVDQPRHEAGLDRDQDAALHRAHPVQAEAGEGRAAPTSNCRTASAPAARPTTSVRMRA
jgi:hypothetical protein